MILASLFFYGWWNPFYLILIIGSVCGNFVFGNWLKKHPSKSLLALTIGLNLGLIAYYKYLGFFSGIYSSIAGELVSIPDILLPLGISFFTFQQITYLVDSYKSSTAPHGFLEYALFVTFFPQLVAGPIVHQAEILPQFAGLDRGIKAENMAMGISVFILGLFKKVVIADQLSNYVSPMFEAAKRGEPISFLEAWGGSLGYTFQLYFDFSGYSDMAIGLALVFGIRLPINFNSPYRALSIIDFWRRWHITLSRFLREYLYIPLGGNRRGTFRRYINVLIVMVLGGLWHGASWTFLWWGFLHGFYLTINYLWRDLKKKLGIKNKSSSYFLRSLSWVITFLAVVIGWVFFRAENWDAAANIISGMSGLNGRFVVTPGYLPFLEPFSAVFGPITVSKTPLLYFD
ncbi:MAG: MBOAT family O-acyltransferase, partial [Pseudomonadota bacterium]|nr:MBOAT family O-acyltransferase [Pseudomonadota bacterium]